MKTSLNLNLSQQLTLTPQLQQAIRLLQLSTLDLNHEIQQAIESNPMLEISTPESTMNKESAPSNQADSITNTHWNDMPFSRKVSHDSSKDYNYENFYGTSTSLHDHLNWQLSCSPMSDIDSAIAMAIIDAVGEDGFLTQTPQELHASLNSEEYPIELEEINAVLHRIQRFEPVGCAAIDLADSLLIQMEQLPQDTPLLELARKIIEQDIQLLGTHNYRQIMKNHNISETQLKGTLLIIQQLNPKPGSMIASNDTRYVTPDVTVKKVDGNWRVSLNNEAIPRLSINNHYASLIRRADTSSDNVYLKNNLQEARWFLKSIQSRQETLFKVASCIVNYQKDFFEHGEEAMKPLVLNDIALALDMHESTISRVTTNKYMYTPRGVFELKYFFSSHVSTVNGGECSSTAIRAFIKKLIAAEDHKKPLSDNKIAKLIEKQGIKVARRTVAKYREAMHIPPSNERKSLIN